MTSAFSEQQSLTLVRGTGVSSKQPFKGTLKGAEVAGAPSAFQPLGPSQGARGLAGPFRGLPGQALPRPNEGKSNF